ncbi:MAG: T4 family baseplate hub assembly chaperone [Planctomycetota bacterium]|jgi:hypothetical protein
MRIPTASEWLAAWERGYGQSPARRALTLLALAFPNTLVEALAELSIGQRDAYLLSLREIAFGRLLHCLVICPKCEERLEAALQVADIRADVITDQTDGLCLAVGEHRVSFRLPNSRDLIAESGNASTARETLLRRCILEASHEGTACPAEQLPADVLQAVVEKMVESDPQADVELDLCCPSCGHQWLAAFDIVSFFWREICAWAQRTLREVHALASAYGWSEEEIVSLSPFRRQQYLQMAHA